MSGEGGGDEAAIIDGLCAAITPASEAQAHGARARLGDRPAALLERLAIWLAAARHAPRPQAASKRIVVVAADHGAGDPGVDLGESSPTLVALRQLAAGDAALSTAARASGAQIALVDAGAWGAAGQIPGLIDVRGGDGTADIKVGPAMAPAAAARAVASGIALSFSLAEEGLDVIALGALGVGSEVASTALIAALADADARAAGGVDADEAAAAIAANEPDSRRPLEAAAAVGGFEIAVLAGAILGAAAIAVPVVLDDHATAAAALLAVRLAPNVRDYVLASHIGSIPAHRVALSALSPKIEPLLSVGVSRGEGTGAAVVLPSLDAAASLLR